MADIAQISDVQATVHGCDCCNRSDQVTEAGTQASDRMGETARHAGHAAHNLGARATDAMIGTDGNTASETVSVYPRSILQ